MNVHLWIDGHHLVHWAEGGSTALENLVLLCHRHHRLVHEGGWQLIRKLDGTLATVAPIIDVGIGAPLQEAGARSSMWRVSGGDAVAEPGLGSPVPEVAWRARSPDVASAG